MELLLGAGTRRTKALRLADSPEGWRKLVTVDINADHNPDVVHDLTVRPWPFADDTFDEVHAYELMEHLGALGDYKAFFADYSEIWRVLKPGGYFFGTSPHWSSPWLWGDPGHTRAISPEMMVFLDQDEYTKQIGKTPMTDYRFVYSADFQTVFSNIGSDKTFQYALRAVKPSRISLRQKEKAA